MFYLQEKVLVGLDDSEQSWNAFKYALMEAETKNLEKLTMVYSEEKAGDEEYRAGEALLSDAKERAEEIGVEVDTKLLIRGYDADKDIVRFAEENGYDQIIIGHKGRSGIRDALLGGVAEGVVENAHCVVTVVRSTPYINKAGTRIRPKDIESLLEEHEGVDRAAVIAIPTDIDEEEIIAFCQAEEGYEPKEDMLLDHLKDLGEEGKIESYALPDRIETLEELPKTDAGTINRDKLREKYT